MNSISLIYKDESMISPLYHAKSLLLLLLWIPLCVATEGMWNPSCLARIATNSSRDAVDFFNNAYHPRNVSDFMSLFFESGPFVLRRRAPHLFANLITLDGGYIDWIH